MKSYVITILDNERSVQVADRCIKSAAKYGIEVEKWMAATPKYLKVIDIDIPLSGFKEKYSRFESCVAAFMSHHSLWELSVQTNEDILILEHDAYFVGPIPNITGDIVNLGKPSYGKFNIPSTLGIGPLASKPYLPGAHAYYVTPTGAAQLITKAQTAAKPTDLFINKNNFPELKELYPWPIEARDSFTTIQNENGCVAKHNYGESYEII